MNAQSTAKTELSTDAMRAQRDRTALGWRNAGSVIEMAERTIALVGVLPCAIRGRFPLSELLLVERPLPLGFPRGPTALSPEAATAGRPTCEKQLHFAATLVDNQAGESIALGEYRVSQDTNLILERLPVPTFKRLQRHLSFQSWGRGSMPMAVGDVEDILFPVSGLASIVMPSDSHQVDTAIVGADGAIGLMAGLSAYRSQVSCVVRVPLKALKIPAGSYRKLAAEDEALRALCFQDYESLLAKTRMTAVGYALTPVVSRFAHILERIADILRTAEIPLTQETIAEMMCVRRTSVTEAARDLKKAGIIDYSRGTITILDRPSLLDFAA